MKIEFNSAKFHTFHIFSTKTSLWFQTWSKSWNRSKITKLTGPKPLKPNRWLFCIEYFIIEYSIKKKRFGSVWAVWDQLT